MTSLFVFASGLAQTLGKEILPRGWSAVDFINTFPLTDWSDTGLHTGLFCGSPAAPCRHSLPAWQLLTEHSPALRPSKIQLFYREALGLSCLVALEPAAQRLRGWLRRGFYN